MVTIGIAIPCYKRHIPHLRRLFESIQNQSILPTKVVVSCSSCSPADFAEEDFSRTYSFPIQILLHDGRKNAAENRNIAARALDTDILSFFDADDVMHPQRIHAILEAFQNSVTNIVLHNYSVGHQEIKPYDSFIVRLNVLRRAPTGCAVVYDNIHAGIHHSQVSVRKTVFEKTQFREEVEMERKEDAVFCGDVLAYSESANAYIADSLSLYFEEGKWY